MKQLSEIKVRKQSEVLTDEEMKKIVGGKEGEKYCEASSCGGPCAVYISSTILVRGMCRWVDASGHLACGCQTYP